MRTEFSHRGYVELVNELLGAGYAVHGFADADPGKRHLILRHDIDMSIEAAFELARVERDAQWRATYFVLLRSGLYNAFSDRGTALLHGILEAGHEIGLHFDASLYPQVRERLEAACADECERLERHLGCRIETVSFHRPAQLLIGAEGRFAGRTHAYEPRFIHEMGYCADSRGDWYHGHPLDHDAIAEGRALQLLTHPIWWNRLPGESAVERLDRFVRDHTDEFRDELAANCTPYRDALRSRER